MHYIHLDWLSVRSYQVISLYDTDRTNNLKLNKFWLCITKLLQNDIAHGVMISTLLIAHCSLESIIYAEVFNFIPSKYS